MSQTSALNDHAAIPRTNWSKNFHFHTDRVYAPTTVEEVQAIVRANPRLKGLGSRHSFNDSADSRDAQISMRAVKSVSIDKAAKTATVGAGIAYGELAPVLDGAGFALHNLASLPHISVGGTIATGTHGSGVHNGNLATAVRGLEIVKADGSVLHLSRGGSPDGDGDTFKAAVVHIGGLGIVTAVTLDLLPRFDMTQVVYEDLSFDQLEHNIEAILGAAYSVSLFTTWQGNRATQVWLKQKVQPGTTPLTYDALPKQFYGATLQQTKLHPLRDKPAQNCTEQMGTVGPWYARLPHFKMEFTPSSGEELQSEFFVPRERAYQAIRAVETLKDRITPHLFITELRTIAADDLPSSMHYRRDSLAIHFTWKPEEPQVRALLPAIEAKLAPFEARPHWGKIFTMDGKALNSRYPHLQSYCDLAAKLDPQGKFRNDFLNRTVFVS